MKARSSICLILLFFSLLAGGGAWLVFGPQKTVSEQENRILTQRPTLTASGLLSGTYSQQLSDFCRDQLPFRNTLLALCGFSQLGLGRMEYNGVLPGKDGYLIATPQAKDGITDDNLQAYLSFQAHCQAQGLPCHLLLAPRGIDILSDKLPALYDTAKAASLLRRAESSVPGSTALIQRFLQEEEPADFRYRTDHHWTTEGAFVAYQTLGRLLGYTPYGDSFFRHQTVTDSFLGTLSSKLCLPLSTPDSVTLYRFEGDEAVLVENTEKKTVTQGFYDFSALSQKDHYRIFLGGNAPCLRISLPSAEEKPSLLLVKDSFANALIPFLSLHYRLTVVDPRYDHRTLSQLLQQEQFDQALILCGAETVSEQRDFLRP